MEVSGIRSKSNQLKKEGRQEGRLLRRMSAIGKNIMDFEADNPSGARFSTEPVFFGSGENLSEVAVGSALYSATYNRHPRKGRPPVGFILKKVGASLIDGNYIFTGALN